MRSAMLLPRLALAVALLELAFAGPIRAASPPGVDAEGVRRVLTLLDVVAEEYREGIVAGQVARPLEYEEAKLFLADARDRAGRAVGASAPQDLGPQFAALARLVEDKAPLDAVRQAGARLAQQITEATGVSVEVYPPEPPSAARGQALFSENCAPCHGEHANGKGPDAADLQPPPANFTDPTFMRAETPYDFFQILSVGKAGTAMPAWGDVFSPQERWDLVSYLWSVRSGAADLAEGQGTYLSRCASCHGAAGDANGIFSAALLRPAPDLSQTASLARTSDTDLFAVVSHGVAGTPMPAFERTLDETQRWKAVAYLRSLSLGGAATSAVATPGGGEPRRLAGLLRLLGDEYAKAVPDAGAVDDLEYRETSILLEQVQRRAPAVIDTLRAQSADQAAELQRRVEQIAAAVHRRSAPAAVQSEVAASTAILQAHVTPAETEPATAEGDALAGTRRLLDDALAAYRRSDARARDLVADAYFKFEPLEKRVSLSAPDLTRRVESLFLDLRGAVAQPGNGEHAASLVGQIGAGLDEVGAALEPTAEPWALFAQSATIILREGFEMVLIVGALIAFVTKSGQQGMRRSILWGTAVGVVLSLLTAWVLTELLRGASGAAAEAIGGVSMLTASLVLFSVSYWLISKAEADKWQRYIQGKVKTALTAGSSLALAGTAALAVYREGVETVLFYNALLGTAAGHAGAVAGGFGVGCLLLAVLYAIFWRFGMRIPIRQFFLATSVLLYYLAVVFAGKGVAELQEAGWVPLTLIGGAPHIDFIGLYPTLETLLAQGVLLALLLLAIGVTMRRRTATPASGETQLKAAS